MYIINSSIISAIIYRLMSKVVGWYHVYRVLLRKEKENEKERWRKERRKKEKDHARTLHRKRYSKRVDQSTINFLSHSATGSHELLLIRSNLSNCPFPRENTLNSLRFVVRGLGFYASFQRTCISYSFSSFSPFSLFFLFSISFSCAHVTHLEMNFTPFTMGKYPLHSPYLQLDGS